MTAYGYDDLDDDSMAANPEPPRLDAPRLRSRPTGGEKHWRFVEVDGPARDVGQVGGRLTCKPAHVGGCGEPATVLHADPRNDSPARTLCSACTGRVMRERVG